MVGGKEGQVLVRIAGLKAKKEQVIIAEDADRKEGALPVENKGGQKQECSTTKSQEVE